MLLCYLLGANPSLQSPPALSATLHPLSTPNHHLDLVFLSCLSASDVKILLYILLCGISGTCTLPGRRVPSHADGNPFAAGGVTNEQQALLQ